MNTFSETQPLVVSPNRAAALLDVSLRTVQEMCAAGQLEIVKVRGSTRIPLDCIHALIESNRVRRGGDGP